MAYDHQNIEQKWQKYWEENKTFRTENGGEKPKKYILDMFPYPSGAGLHVGHPKGYTATDIVSRYYHATGHNVLHTMGFDAFGLPAENYAIKTGTHPAITTAENITVFTEQLKGLGFSYDWDRVVDTTDPEYYRWTQWIFLELFKRGLAYEQDLPINYCPSCKTGLANEEVTTLNTCDRCGTRVERRPIRQWVLRITEYADRLLSDIDGLDWPEGIKEMQRNWIGRSEGCEFKMMKKVESKPLALLLHGWDNVENRTDWHWMSSTKTELEIAGYEVVMEQLPGNNAPNLEKQIAFLDQYRDRLNEQSIIIGHSMGGFLGMHFVERLDKKIGKLICVAPIFNRLIDHVDWSKEATGWDIGSISMQQDYNPELIKKNVNSWHVFLSEDDGSIIYPEAKKHFDAIGGVVITSVSSAGHFCEENGYATFPALLEALDHISVYTTRVDTVYGMTYAVLAPDHPQVQDFITSEKRAECEQYIERAKGQSDLDRTNEGREKTGVFTGSYVVNPFNGESVPLWIADYVLGSYGTGAVMAVPAHDERDFEFAKKYNLDIKQSIRKHITYTDEKSPRKDVETLYRKVVDMFIENDKGEFLLLREENPTMYHFVGGGIEDNETELEAVRKEIIEETGYTDFEVLGPVNGTFKGSFAYRFPKAKNQDTWGRFFHIKLNSNTQILSEIDEGKHSVEWYHKNDVASKLGWGSHSIAWDVFINGIRPTTEDGFLVNSSEYDGLTSTEARRVFSEKAETEGFGSKKVNYKLRDWLFSRQRYWGEPIPLIHIANEDYAGLPRTQGGSAYIETRGESEFLMIDGVEFSQVYAGITGKLIIDSRLPVTLPEVERYEPAGDGQSPLATVPDWVNVELAENLNGKRETNTMPQWGGSCWYYLRYMNNKNSDALASPEALDYWGMVDEYVGGAEHAVLHLLYARFWHKVLYDIGVVPHAEPFQKLTNVGMILAYAYERADGSLVAVDMVEEQDGQYIEKETGTPVKQVVAKMSKSLKNVVNPNDIVAEYGADTLRLYEMSISGFTDTAPWNPDAIIGVRRFLDKAYATIVAEDRRQKTEDSGDKDMKRMKLLHKTIKKVGEDIVAYKFNTAISALQILLNEGIPTDVEFASEWSERFAIMLHPFAPHMAEELYQLIENREQRAEIQNDSALPTTNCQLPTERSIYFATWPSYDEWMLVDDEVTIAIQINGKLRGTYTGLNGVMQDEVSAYAHETADIAKWLEGKTLVKEIFVPNKLLSIVVKDAE